MALKGRGRRRGGTDIDAVGPACEWNLAAGGQRRTGALAAVVSGHLEQLVRDEAEGPHDTP